MNMTLKMGKNQHTYIVRSIQLELSLERRLESLGLTEGALITILNNDKKGSYDCSVPWDKICPR